MDLHSLIVPDHFFSRCVSGKVKDVAEQTFLIEDALLREGENQEMIDKELVIERNKHLCVCENFWDVSETAHLFVKNFKTLFQIKDKSLFENKNFDFDIDDISDILHKIQSFVKEVSTPLSDA